jgi:alcohol dehydrogenase class IV
MPDDGANVRFGNGVLAELPELLKLHGIERALVVTGRRSWEAARGADMERRLAGVVQLRFFCSYETNPRLPDVVAGLDALRQTDADAVIGVGGGTAMDLAKAIAILADQNADPASVVLGQVPITRPRRRLLVLVPTTSGTGSEVTCFAVVYVDRQKHSLDHSFVTADYAIIDPYASAGMPRSLTATTGADALAQAIESFWSVRSTTVSRAIALRALDLIQANWVQSCEGSTMTNRHAMAEAAYLAGCAIDATRTTAPHALSYPLTIRHGVPHGHACALTLPQFLLFNADVSPGDVADPRGASFVHDRIAELLAHLGVATPSDGALRLTHLIAQTGLGTRLRDVVSDPDAAIADAIADVNPDRLANNPRHVNFDTLWSILTGIQ